MMWMSWCHPFWNGVDLCWWHIVELITCQFVISWRHSTVQRKKGGILDLLQKLQHLVDHTSEVKVITSSRPQRNRGSSQSWWPHPFVQIDHCGRCGGCTIHGCSASRSKWPTTPGCTKRYQKHGIPNDARIRMPCKRGGAGRTQTLKQIHKNN